MNTTSLSDYLANHQANASIQQWHQHIEQQFDHYYFENGTSIRHIVLARSHAIDESLRLLWQQAGLESSEICLFAVGGYGRQEMLPYSDVDIMLFSEHELNTSQEHSISKFIASLWDTGFKPGVSVRTAQSCIEQAKQDITIATSLIESRLIVGDERFSRWPKQMVSQTWTDRAFFDAKMTEQKKRYSQHNYTESNLEPDIKNAPGGLRDMNQIAWVAKRHFRVNRIYDLVHLGFISEFELKILEEAETFYWEIRHYLHRLTKRDENRLLFDYQKEISSKFGHIHLKEQEQPTNHGVEQFMRRYYRKAQQVATLNEVLLAFFNQSVIEPRSKDYIKQVTVLNERFTITDHKIAVQHHRVFSENPSAILEIFHLIAIHPEIKGIRARTLRLLVLAAKNIDEHFRQQPEHQALFLKIIQSSTRLYETLSHMRRYGILGKYLPAFGQIMGLMQYDLFHIYTVDQHTLFLIRNLERFKEPEFAKDFPVVSSVYQRLKKRDVIMIAALFHDIAKGRNGDHCILGAEDARQFCKMHRISDEDTHLIAWLIENHLLISLTAQKKDISDPDVIQEFASKLKDMDHLDYLYTLTVADINATNPKLWNTWRASLMRQLYTQTREVIRKGIDRPVDYQMLIEDTKFYASERLVQDFSLQRVEAVWQALGDEYFLKESVDDVTWCTHAILEHNQDTQPLIKLRAQRKTAQDAVQIFIYTQDKPNLFATTVAVLDRMNLDVQDARIITSKTDFSLDTYIVLDRFGTLLTDPERQKTVIQALSNALSHVDEYPNLMQRRIPRQLRHFNIENIVNIKIDDVLKQHEIEISTLDHPGLLAKIGGLFMMQGLDIHSAKIATLGEKVEDIFYVTKKNGMLMSDEESTHFAFQLKSALDEASNQVTNSTP
ncbi:[protein-PII] uridylyltransferase [Acinetobacter sp. B10A]|uniref:[protein-PII] uridylyltransferase n=1 Tax=Acinetobacter baretiae TaxID=2605383 RepID=UPI001B3C845B|nr:[protein-PII] uridylyltransferase [Acinetobacter baretiae]MBF7685880.1 [protein-PII] uridylyltransferase [Acinetobacter baretiae]